MVFPVVMYGCKSRTIKKAGRLLRVPWTASRSNQSIIKKSVLNIHWKDWNWSWNSSTLATWCEELTHWERPWCWERLKAGEGNDRGWDGWMASPTRWTWVSASSRSWWCTGKPGVLQSMGLQRVRHDWAVELNWTDFMLNIHLAFVFRISLKQLHFVFQINLINLVLFFPFYREEVWFCVAEIVRGWPRTQASKGRLHASPLHDTLKLLTL